MLPMFLNLFAASCTQQVSRIAARPRPRDTKRCGASKCAAQTHSGLLCGRTLLSVCRLWPPQPIGRCFTWRARVQQQGGACNRLAPLRTPVCRSAAAPQTGGCSACREQGAVTVVGTSQQSGESCRNSRSERAGFVAAARSLAAHRAPANISSVCQPDITSIT